MTGELRIIYTSLKGAQDIASRMKIKMMEALGITEDLVKTLVDSEIKRLTAEE